MNNYMGGQSPFIGVNQVGGFPSPGGQPQQIPGGTPLPGSSPMDAYLPQNGGGQGNYNEQALMLANGGAQYSPSPAPSSSTVPTTGGSPYNPFIGQGGLSGYAGLLGGSPYGQGASAMGGLFGIGGRGAGSYPNISLH